MDDQEALLQKVRRLEAENKTLRSQHPKLSKRVDLEAELERVKRDVEGLTAHRKFS